MKCTFICLKAVVVSLSLIHFSTQVSAQNFSQQIVRGRVLDDVSQYPIANATINITGDNTSQTQSDSSGYFQILASLGRQTIFITAIGYESKSIPEILVTAGKQEVITVLLTEKINILDEVVIKATKGHGLNNEMISVSGTSFNPSDTRRFAGAIGDPSRMITGVAGVASNSDARNDIVVRGNSPSGLLWQIEGVNIPNPNHYGSLGSTGGPVSMLNSNNLAKSDFIAAAFPAQYGNALASVFDLRLKNGNADRTEFVGEMSFTGFEAGIEGPFSKKGRASYIFNYRYSTVGILNSIGFNVGTGTAVPQYQDINFKIDIPLSSKNKLSIWGLGGPSKINFWGNEADTLNNKDLYGNENANTLSKYFKAILGANLETNFSKKTYGRLNIGASRYTEELGVDSISIETRTAFPSFRSNYKTNRYEIGYSIAHKFNAKTNMVSGISATDFQFDLLDRRIYGNNAYEFIRIKENSSTQLLQLYTQWKHRFSKYFMINAGLHYQLLTLNNTSALEPRLAFQYNVSLRQFITLGYGLHSQMQSPTVYYKRNETTNEYTNKSIGFTKSHHFVLGYQNKFANDIYFKSEVYYQKLFDVPVTTYPSGFSVLNEGADFVSSLKDSLQNKGSGYNYGIEASLEKYFSNNYYFLITGTIFQSKYKGSDGILRNTAFNNNYIANILAGKEFNAHIKDDNNTFSVSLRLTSMGGKYTSPLDLAASEAQLFTVYDEINAPYTIRQSPYFRTDLKLGYRRNNKRSTLEGGIDFRNLTNYKNVYMQTYNRRTNSIVTQYQQGLLVVPYFRLTF